MSALVLCVNGTPKKIDSKQALRLYCILIGLLLNVFYSISVPSLAQYWFLTATHCCMCTVCHETTSADDAFAQQHTDPIQAAFNPILPQNQSRIRRTHAELSDSIVEHGNKLYSFSKVACRVNNDHHDKYTILPLPRKSHCINKNATWTTTWRRRRDIKPFTWLISVSRLQALTGCVCGHMTLGISTIYDYSMVYLSQTAKV